MLAVTNGLYNYKLAYADKSNLYINVYSHMYRSTILRAYTFISKYKCLVYSVEIKVYRPYLLKIRNVK